MNAQKAPPTAGGSKGRRGSGKTADVSTAGVNAVNDEERNEALDWSPAGAFWAFTITTLSAVS